MVISVKAVEQSNHEHEREQAFGRDVVNGSSVAISEDVASGDPLAFQARIVESRNGVLALALHLNLRVRYLHQWIRFFYV